MRDLASKLKPGTTGSIGDGTHYKEINGETWLSATRWGLSFINQKEDRFYIKGRFQVIADLQQRFPRWRHVDDSFPIEMHWRRPESFRRVSPLLAGKSPGESLYLIAINAQESKAPREAEFLGPLKPGEVPHIRAMVELLAMEPYAKMSQGRASVLTGSRNPWMAWLGLVRLDEMKALRAEHFARALRCRAAEDLDTIWWEMTFNSTMTDPFMRSLPSIALSDNVSPVMRKKVLQKIVGLYQAEAKSGKGKLDWDIDLPRFQKAVRAYRPKAAADPELKELVVYFDQILALQ